MIKFFRRIRQKLIQEGNLKRYLIYATGEILLVMIGILLALQVNIWNEDRKLQNSVKNSIISLKTEFANNLTKEIALLNLIQDKENQTRAFLLFIANNDISDTTKIKQGPSYLYNNLEIEYRVLNSLFSNGRIEDIKNDSLKHLVNDWNYLTTRNQRLSKIKDDLLNILRQYERARIPSSMRLEDGNQAQAFYSETEVMQMRNRITNDLEYRNYLTSILNMMYSLRKQAENKVELSQKVIEVINRKYLD